MKVLLICNMNNNFFSFARHLRDRGIEADLALLNGEEQDHFHPRCDSTDNQFEQFVFELNWYQDKSFAFGKQQLQQIRALRKKYNVIVGCGYSAMCFAKFGLKLDVFMPYGSDLYKAPFFNKNYLAFELLAKLDFMLNRLTTLPLGFSLLRALRLNYLARLYLQFCKARYQAQGIKTSSVIISMAVSDNFFESIKKLDVQHNIRKIPLPMLYSHPSEMLDPSDSSTLLMQKLKNQFKLVIFHHTRHSWYSSPNQMSNKRNDILFKGVASCLKILPSDSLAIVTLEYGPDVATSKNLIKSLGIEKNVFWLPTMKRKEILPLLRYSDIGAVDFGMSWIQGGVLYEYLSTGIAVMQVRDDAIHTTDNKTLYPCIKVKSEDDVCRELLKYEKQTESLKIMGQEGKDWYKQAIIDSPLDKYKELFVQLAKENKDNVSGLSA